MNFAALRQISAVLKIKQGLETLQQIDPNGKISGVTDALLGLENAQKSCEYIAGWKAIDAAGIDGILRGKRS